MNLLMPESPPIRPALRSNCRRAAGVCHGAGLLLTTMDTRTLKDTICEAPHTKLLEVIDAGWNHEEMLSLFDVELKRSSLRLQRLQEYRNALASPMYCIIPELLSRILFIYAESDDALFDLGWTKIMFVCRR